MPSCIRSFAENRYVYVCYVHPGDGRHTRVSRFTLNGESPPRAVAGSEQVLITWPAGGHNAGCLEFGKDGYLYIATGDGSGPNPPDGLTTGQTVSDLLGAILRIDVDQRDGEQALRRSRGQSVCRCAGARPEIWAYGLRNPWKFGIDPQTGDIFAADNGWESWEMVHRIVRGGNCGWPVMEGRAALRAEVKPRPDADPAAGEGPSAHRGQLRHRRAGLSRRQAAGAGRRVRLWRLHHRHDLGREARSGRLLLAHDARATPTSGSSPSPQGSGGELFVLDYDFTGQIYELLASGLKDTSATFPRRLSETGLFASLEMLEPAPGVVPYSVQVERWMDGAQAQRWVAIPGNGQIRTRDRGRWLRGLSRGHGAS